MAHFFFFLMIKAPHKGHFFTQFLPGADGFGCSELEASFFRKRKKERKIYIEKEKPDKEQVQPFFEGYFFPVPVAM